MNTKTLIHLALISLLIILVVSSRLIGIAFNDNTTNGYVYTKNNDQLTFKIMLQRQKEGIAPFNRNYPPAFPTLLLVTNPYMENFSSHFPKVAFLKTYFLTQRVFSYLFTFATIILVYLFTLSITNKIYISFVTSIFYLCAPLSFINSFYGTADSMNSFLYCLSLYLIHYSINSRNKTICNLISSSLIRRVLLIIITAFVSGICIATKITLSIAFPLAYLAFNRKLKLLRIFRCLIIALLLAVGFFISFGNQDPIKLLHNIYNISVGDNINVKDHMHILNPLFYSIQMLVAVGLPCFLLACYALIEIPFKLYKEYGYKIPAVLLIGIFSHLLLISTLSIPTSRHLMPLVPLTCILSGYGLALLIKRRNFSQKVILVLIFISVLYSALAALSSLGPYIFTDNESKMGSWARNQLRAGKTIHFDRTIENYAKRYNTDLDRKDADIMIGNFKTLMKYQRSQINPWGNADCSKKLYHTNKKECESVQSIILNKKDYYLKENFITKPFMPEQLLHYYIWGDFDNFAKNYYVFIKR